MAGYEDFVDFSYKPAKSDMIVSFRVGVPAWETKKRAWGAVASESSVGTWAKVVGLKYEHVKKVAAKVFWAGKDGWIKIAYPVDHFEYGNMAQILASIAGNDFGMKAVSSLRLQDVKWPAKIIKAHPGPQFGIKGIRKIFGVKKRPLMLSVPKPKVGMTTQEHAQIGYDIWTGGLDLLKDDENLSNQKFNPFEKRVKLSLKMRDKAEKETGEKKSYLINVTAPTTDEMLRRAKFVANEGGEYAMIDVITSGWTSVRTLREHCADLGLAIHAHRAFHGAFDRNPKHGFSNLAVGEVVRLLGVDQYHIGTHIGKMVSPKHEVLDVQEHITQQKVKENLKEHCLSEDWLNMKNVFPVASGGLQPALIPYIVGMLGTDIMLQLGGGVHGHPKGSHAGAVAMRAALEATLAGNTLEDAMRSCKELKQAMDYWGYTRPR